MTKETFCEAEERRFNKLKNMGLPNSFKKIGIAIVVLTFVFLIVRKIFDLDIPVLKIVVKRITLLGLLLIVLAREKVEDEMIKTIRAQALSMALIMGVVYVLVQPLVNYGVGLLISPEDEVLKDLGDFQIIWFMLTIYLAFFYLIKRKY